MSNTRTHALLPGFSVALSALLRVARTLVAGLLLIAMALLAFGVAAVVVLRLAWKGRHRASFRTGAQEPLRQGGRGASTSRPRGAAADVVDVEAREIVTPPPRDR